MTITQNHHDHHTDKHTDKHNDNHKHAAHPGRSVSRARWAAIGAAVAVSIGAGGVGLANAAISDGPLPVYQAIAPCRLVDTRPAPDHVGEIAGVLTGGTTVNVLGADGAQHGNCTIPAGATALTVNATSLNASDPTFLQFAPGGTLVAGESSSLNPSPDQPPTPNAVNVPLAADGSFDVYNAVGTVDVIFDVVGYYVDHEHTGDDIVDGSLTAADVQDETLTGADIDDHSVSSVDTSNEAGVAFTSTDHSPPVELTSTPSVIGSVPIRVPSNGYVSVTASINWMNLDISPGFDIAQCQITKGTTIDSDQPWFNLNDFDSGVTLALTSDTSHRTLSVLAEDNPPAVVSGQPLNLVCDEITGDVQIHDVHLTAQFVPTSYNPNIFILPTIPIPFP